MHVRHLALPLVALSLAGAGCFHFGPRIAKAPEPTQVAAGQPAQATSTEPTALAYVELDGGAATVTRNGQGYPAQDGMELDQGDEVSVTTGPVHLLYPDAGMSELAAGTKLTIIPDDGEGETGIFAQIRLEAGSIWTRFEKVFGPSERFSVSGNGVVATVRGTGFGMSATEDGAVDVQVADHAVQVSAEAEDDQNGSSQPTGRHVVALAAGQGLRITAGALLKLDATSVRTAVRKLTDAELAARGFLFGKTPLLPTRLTRPLNPIRLPVTPVLDQALETRIQILRRAAMLERVFPRFVAPLSAPLEGTLVPTTTQGTTGPTIAPLQ